MQPIGLGLALVPSKEMCEHIRGFVKSLADDGLEFSFAIDRSESTPHVSILQATFDAPEQAITAIDRLDRSKIEVSLSISDLSIWATHILFLNFALPSGLKQFHYDVFGKWRKLASQGSADPQFFTGITSGQQKSYDETGYPFSLGEYMPHITLAHLKDGEMAKMAFERRKPLMMKVLPKTLHFDRLVAFAVEPLGVCHVIQREWELSPPKVN